MKAQDTKKRFGWCLYDWANSAFATIILAAVLPIYFAESIVPEQGANLTFVGIGRPLNATSIWGYASGLTSFLILISAPILGGIADRSHNKKLFLMVFCYLGALLTILLSFMGPGDVWMTLFLFCLAQYFFVGGNVFYDAFLPFLARGRDMDQLSSRGYALGYLGGGLLLALSFFFIQFSHYLGIQGELAAKLSLAAAGVWWAGFGTISFMMFGEDKLPAAVSVSLFQAAFEGVRKIWETTKTVARYRQILIFLFAFMIYNDGVQTVIRMASIYGKDELHLSTSTLLGTLLVVQFVGMGGALVMAAIAKKMGTKQTIMGILLAWIALTFYASKMKSSLEFWIMGGIVGLILGGTQALSRSYFGRIIPTEQSAQFFGYFSAFSKLSAIWGPILFAFIRQVTGTSRLSVLYLSLFFVIGGCLLYFVKDKKAPISPTS